MKNRSTAELLKGLLVCALVFGFVASCSVGGDEGAPPSVITVDESDYTPPPEAESDSDVVAGAEPEETPTPEPTTPAAADVVAIAKCLTVRGAVLYGASWCSYTQSQIDAFGDGFAYLRYVECTEQEDLCDEAGISGYPTWIIGETRILGYTTPTSLADTAGYPR